MKTLLITIFVLLLSGTLYTQQHNLSAEIIRNLKEGNKRFQIGERSAYDFIKERSELADGQDPVAIILSCSDSRVVPEYLFDVGQGKLFVIRNAGNLIDSVALGSIEYAAAKLHTPLLIILGHTSCGAVTAAVKGKSSSPFINSIINKIEPAVDEYEHSNKHSKNNEHSKIDFVIKQNVINQMNLVKDSKIISDLLSERKFLIIGAVYDIESGIVEFIND